MMMFMVFLIKSNITNFLGSINDIRYSKTTEFVFPMDSSFQYVYSLVYTNRVTKYIIILNKLS